MKKAILFSFLVLFLLSACNKVKKIDSPMPSSPPNINEMQPSTNPNI